MTNNPDDILMEGSSGSLCDAKQDGATMNGTTAISCDGDIERLVAFDALCAAADLPYKSQIDETHNILFWKECAKACLRLSRHSGEGGDRLAARYYRRMFRVAQSNRRMRKHLRIVSLSDYAPVVRCIELLKMIYQTGRVYSYQPEVFSPLLKPFSTWSERLGLGNISNETDEQKALETLDKIQSSIIVALEYGLTGQSPTDSARLIVNEINRSIREDLATSKTHGAIYVELHNLKRFLAPYLLDVSYFKKKHRIDTFLN